MVTAMRPLQPPAIEPTSKGLDRHPGSQAQPAPLKGLVSRDIKVSHGKVPDQDQVALVETSLNYTGIGGVFNALHFKLSVFSKAANRFFVVESTLNALSSLSHSEAARILDSGFWGKPISVSREPVTRREFVEAWLTQLAQQASKLVRECREGPSQPLQHALDQTAQTIAERLAFEVRVERDTTGSRILRTT